MKGLISAAAATLLLLSACGDGAPKTIKDIDSSILSVNDVKTEGKTVLRIVWKLPGMSAESDMSNAALGMERVLKGIVTYFPEQSSDEIRFVLNANLVDRYGNESRHDVFEVPYAMSEVRKVNFGSESFNHWNLLNLSGRPTLRHPTGLELVSEYCKDKSNAKYARDFCIKGLLPTVAL